MPRTITRNIKPPESAGPEDYTSVAQWAQQEVRDLPKMRGILFTASPTTLTKNQTYTFSGGWQGKFKGLEGATTLGRFEAVSLDTVPLPLPGETVAGFQVQSVDYSDGEIALAVMYAMVDTNPVTDAGFVQSASCYLKIMAAPGAAANAIWRSSGVATIDPNRPDAGAVQFTSAFSKIEGIQVGNDGSTASSYGLSLAGATATGVFARIRGTGGNAFILNSAALVSNCIAWGGSYAFDVTASTIYNCAGYGTVNGSRGLGVGSLARNCVFYGNSADWTGNLFNWSSSCSNNAGGTASFPRGTYTALSSSPWTNAPAGNFTISAASPLVDKGANLAAQGVTTDIAGTARPQGSASDIGPYEYVAVTVPITASVLTAQGTWVTQQVGAHPGDVVVTLQLATGLWVPNNPTIGLGSLVLQVEGAVGVSTALPTTLVLTSHILSLASLSTLALPITVLPGSVTGLVNSPSGLWSAGQVTSGLGGVSVATTIAEASLAPLVTSLRVGEVYAALQSSTLSLSALATGLQMGGTSGTVDEALLQVVALPTTLLLPGIVGILNTAQAIGVAADINAHVGGISVEVSRGLIVSVPLPIAAILGQLGAIGESRILRFEAQPKSYVESAQPKSYLVAVPSRVFKAV